MGFTRSAPRIQRISWMPCGRAQLARRRSRRRKALTAHLTKSSAFRYSNAHSAAALAGRRFYFGRPHSRSREAGFPRHHKELTVSLADATSAIVPTYARADVAFERGEGCWLTSTTGERYLDFGAGIAVTSVGHAHPHLVETLDEPGLEAVARFEPLPECPRASASRAASSTRPSPISFSSPTRRGGQRGRDQDGAQAPFGRRPSRALSHPHLRGRLPWPHAGDDRRRRPGQISRRLRPQGRRLRPDPGDRPRCGRGGDRAGDRRDHDRADPGRGRGAGHSPGLPAGLARDLRPARPALDL